MNLAQAFTRLDALQSELSQLHLEHAVLQSSYHHTRNAVTTDQMQQGQSPTSARAWAEASAFEARKELEKVAAQIASLTEERDHLRFCIDHARWEAALESPS